MSKLLKIYNNDSCKKCLVNNELCRYQSLFNSHHISLIKLNKLYGNLLDKFKEDDILICGMQILNCILNIEIKDPILNIFIKNISKEKIIKLNSILSFLYENNNIIIIREPFSIVWLICNSKYETILQINLDIMEYKSWDEALNNSPLDFFCIGFSTLQKKFIYLKNRWRNFMNNYLKKSITFDHPYYSDFYFTKYLNTKFNFNIVNNQEPFDYHYIFNTFYDFNHVDDYCSSQFPIFITKNIKDILSHLNIKYIIPSNIKNIMQQIDSMEESEGELCNILFQKTNILLINKNCSHEISLKSYLKCKINKCPFCRVNFNPKLKY